MGKLSGKIALVTGGNSGIGLATAKRFVAEGAYVYITGRRQESLDAAVKEIGPNVTAIQGDVSRLDDLKRLFVQIKQEKGRLDVVFANAGGGEFVSLGSYTEEHFDKTFNINVKGLVFTVQEALPLLPNGATIVLNGSIVSIKGFENFGVYNATKAAVRSFARTWTNELKSRKIRVNVVSPGPIDTPQSPAWWATTPSRRSNSNPSWLLACLWAAWASRMNWPKQSYFLPRTTAASSPASSCSSMVGLLPYK
jgi:NAD(P)-dependent dehydrogenase (short-subunit alcohol dehydrogenase family)